MESFTLPLLGGLLIGLTTAAYLLLTGKVVGISGILAQALFSKDRLLPFLFIIGLILGGSAYGIFVEPSQPFPEMRSPILLIISGLLVGYGTRLGSGCTSGHGVCGIGRFSLRSLVATIVFMSTGILTVAIVNFI